MNDRPSLDIPRSASASYSRLDVPSVSHRLKCTCAPLPIASGYGFLLIKTVVLGRLLYLTMAASVVRAGWAQSRAGRDDAAWPGARVGIVGIAALLVLNLTHTVVDIPEGAIAFSLFFGMIMAGVNGSSIR